MKLLSTSQNNKVKFVLHPHNYTHLYNHLLRSLPSEYKNLFAKPSKQTGTTTWMANVQGHLVVYDKLSEEDKNWVADYLEAAVEEVGKALQNDSTFKNFHEDLFKTPSTRSIITVKTEKGIVVVLTEWGCQDNKATAEYNPIRTTINKPRPDRTRVVINVQYTDGTPAENQLFSVDYGTHQKSYKANGDGVRDLGKFRLGSQFVVYSDLGGKRKYPHDFRVAEGGEYLVVFPLLVEGKVKVVNQKNKAVPESVVFTNYGGEQKEINTGQLGLHMLDGLEVGKEITITPKGFPESAKTFTIKRNKNNFVVEINQPFFADALIRVVNQRGETLSDVALTIELLQHKNSSIL